MPRLSFRACVFPQLRWHTPLMFDLPPPPPELIQFISFGREISEPKQAQSHFLWRLRWLGLQKQPQKRRLWKSVLDGSSGRKGLLPAQLSLSAAPGKTQRETMMSALPPGPGPLAWQCGQSNTFPSATTRAFMLLFPDLFGLKHVELNIHPAPCSSTCITPEIDLWETGCSFCHPTLGICVSVVIEKSTRWSGWEVVQSCTHSYNTVHFCALWMHV